MLGRERLFHHGDGQEHTRDDVDSGERYTRAVTRTMADRLDYR